MAATTTSCLQSGVCVVTIGQFISSLEFSDAEKDRIATALRDESSLPYRVFKTRGPEIRDLELWRHTYKRFSIAGFRPGHPAGKKMVMKKAFDSLNMKDGSHHHRIWPLYRSAVVDYVIHELEPLNSLLSSENVPSNSDSSTENVFRCIKRVMPLYEATADQIRELYELWGFDRSDCIDGILAENEIEPAIVRRLIERDITKAAAKLETQIGQVKASLKSGEDQRKEYADQLAETNGELVRLEREMADSISQMSVSLATAQEALNDLRRQADRRFQGGAESTELEHDRSNADAIVVAGLRGRIEHLAALVRKHENWFAELRQTPAQPRGEFPLSRSSETLAQVLSRCQSVFIANDLPNATLGTAWLLLEILRRSRVLLTPNPRLVLDLLTACQKFEVRYVTASPLWIDRSQWIDEVRFISEVSAGNRVLVFLDFDVAIQEAYLLPSLRTWMASVPAVSANRIILVPAADTMRDVSSRVVEFASVLEQDVKWSEDIEKGGSEAQSTDLESWATGQPAPAMQYEQTQNREYEAHIRQLTLNCEAEVPADVASRFVSLSTGISERVSHSQSVQIAAAVSILPWIRLSRGDGMARLVEETLRTASGGIGD